jgi:hypothetical protein
MTLADRYALAEAGSGALLLDLSSGNILELNASSRFIWRLALSGEAEATIAAELVRRHALDADTARDHVRLALSPSVDDIPGPPPTDFHYERRGADYVFHFRGEAALIVDDRGERIGIAGAPEGVSLNYLLQAIAPKVLSLRGHPVLHASAVALPDRAVAFSGYSRAGKTSTARAFAKAGGELICEDKLLLVVGETETRTPRFAERAIGAWIASTAEALRAAKPATCAGLEAALEGETIPLSDIGFLDAQRRTPGPYAASPLSETRTAGAVFRYSFYGSDSNRDWVRRLHAAARIGQSVRGFDLTVPDGLERLAAAVAPLFRARSLRP